MMAAGSIPSVSAYVQDGLILHMDGIEKGSTTNRWTSVIGGYQFVPQGSGTVLFNDNNIELDGSSYLRNSSFTPVSSNVGTIEVVTEITPTNSCIFIPRWGTGYTIAAGMFGSGFLFGVKTATARYPNATGKLSISANGDRCIYNGVGQQVNGSDYIAVSGLDYNLIGARYRNSAYGYYATGKIYSIRIYNRKLTEEEMLSNFSIDKARFGI